MRLLITGATGKVGQEFLRQFLVSEKFEDWQVVALCPWASAVPSSSGGTVFKEMGRHVQRPGSRHSSRRVGFGKTSG